jgi:hypothetical protein
MLPAPLSRDPRIGHTDAIARYLTPTERRQLTVLTEERAVALTTGDKAKEGEISSAILALYERGGEARIADVKLQTNEQIKYSGTFMNGMAIAIFSVGALAPVLGSFVPGSPYSNNIPLLAGVSMGCFLASLGLHLLVRQMLRRLKA